MQTAECSGACNARDSRVEILAVQRSAVRSAVPERARRVPCHLLSGEHGRLLDSLLASPTCAESSDVARWRAAAGRSKRSKRWRGQPWLLSCLALSLRCNRIEGRWTPEGRKQQVPAVTKRKSEWGREAPQRARSRTSSAACLPVLGSRRQHTSSRSEGCF